MKLKLIKPYSLFAKGDVIDVGRGVAELLIERKVAEPAEEKKKVRVVKDAVR